MGTSLAQNEKKVVIRTFQPQDTAAVHQLFASGLLEFAGQFRELVRKYVNQSLQEDLKDISGHYVNPPRHHFWVAELDGQIKGMVGIDEVSQEEAELRRMSVASDMRRQAIGWKLLEATEAFCRQRGYQRIQLYTADFLHPAHALYQKFGYQLVAEDKYGGVIVKRFVKQLQ